MKISSLILKNVGPYEGINKIDFQIENGLPLILFRGHNGAGKTHIYEAIKFCLYGRKILNSNTNDDRKYKAFLREFTHQSTVNEKIYDGFVEIEIIPENNNDGNFIVKREWDLKKDNFESIYISSSNKLIQNFHKNVKSNLKCIQCDEAQEVIESQLPFQYSNLYFYDGEETKKIFKDRDYRKILKLLKSVLGIDTVNQTINDVTAFETKHFSETNQDSDSLIQISKKIKELNQKLEKVIANIDILTKRKADKVKKIESKNSDLDLLKEKFAESGGNYFIKRDDNESQLETKKNNLKEDYRSIKSLCQGDLPLVFCIPLLKERLKMDLDIKKKGENKIIYNFICSKEFESIFKIDINNSSLKSKIKDRFDPQDSHNEELQNILPSRITFSLIEEVKRSFNKILNDIEATNTSIMELNDQILKAPDEALVKDRLDALLALEKKIIEYTSEKDSFEEKIDALIIEKAEIEKNLEEEKRNYRIQDRSSRAVDLIKDSKSIFIKFSEILKDKKVKKFEIFLKESINKMMRKKDYIAKIEINLNTDKILFYNTDETLIPRFSAGEYHIISVAWIWALSQISSKSIPFVIDTPMGSGLDEIHKENLINVFLKNLSKQTVVLSNDDEIDDKSYQKLQSLISKTYRLKNFGSSSNIERVKI